MKLSEVNKKKTPIAESLYFSEIDAYLSGTPGESRTPNLLIRSQEMIRLFTGTWAIVAKLLPE
jgi:hypothetical protein